MKVSPGNSNSAHMMIYTQFFRYAVVGLISNLLLYLAYISLTTLGVGPKSAMSALYALSVLLTFIVNRRWSFNHGGMAHAAFVRYVVAYALGYLINLGLLWLFVDRLHLPHQIVQAVAIVVVAISLFLLHRYWVFAPSARSSAT